MSIKPWISSEDGSLSSVVALCGFEDAESEDIAESIEDVRGMASATLLVVTESDAVLLGTRRDGRGTGLDLGFAADINPGVESFGEGVALARVVSVFVLPSFVLEGIGLVRGGMGRI